MSKKVKAITETATKTIINLDIAATILSKDDMNTLHHIINRLRNIDLDNSQHIQLL